MEHARSILESLINKNSLAKKAVLGYKAADLWNEIIDPKNESWVDKFSKGTLHIKSENPSFIQNLIFKKREIIEKLNNGAGDNVIKDLKLIISSQRNN